MRRIIWRTAGLLAGGVLGLCTLAAAGAAVPSWFFSLGQLLDLTRTINHETDVLTTFTPAGSSVAQSRVALHMEQTVRPAAGGAALISIEITGLTRSSVMAARLSYSVDLDGDGESTGPMESNIVLDVATVENHGVTFRPVHVDAVPAPAANPVESSANPPPPGDPNHHSGIVRLPIAKLAGLVPANARGVEVLVMDRDLNWTACEVSLP